MTQWDPPGAFTDGDATWFRLWSSSHRACAVRLHDATGRAVRDVQLDPRGDGVFEARVVGVGHGARYEFVLDGTAVADPYARWLPDGITGPAMVYASQYRWQHAPVSRPLRDHVIYELHVGTFT
ncbi:MAG: malto-oligosyltrehalose trehalohydrolase, partial [Deltaproteobacteria bacterium]|nr:malto-oligosyltrehalose trehalohydrolase [Deltaproteobacteria bacterium]